MLRRTQRSLLLLVAFVVTLASADANGGKKCAGCTIVTSIAQQIAQIHSLTGSEAFKTLCGYFPNSLLVLACDVGIEKMATFAGPLIDAGEGPDAICNAFGACHNDTAVCRLFPGGESEAAFSERVERIRPPVSLGSFNICTILPAICRLKSHLPASDNDGDFFSTVPTLRGSFWRGKDCNDNDASVFPGRMSSDATVDENCNGIYGVNTTTGTTYEDAFCAGSGAMGIAALGDSATAHFRIPRGYMNVSMLSAGTLSHILRDVENEADWPMLSWSTGHLNASAFSPDVEGPMTSLYSKLVERNRCNHRDFANLGVNGARADDLLPFTALLNRNRSGTAPVKPLLVVFSMVGNDICGHQHSFSPMTTPQKYYDAIVAALDNADTFLPRGSRIVLVPLVDGRFLYDTMHNMIHPLGATNNDLTYAQLYDFLNCLDISPCWGWLNTNETVRNISWSIAQAMNDQLPLIVKESKGRWANFDVHYVGNVFDIALQTSPYPPVELVEPIDGFHPSQTGNSWIGETFFQLLDEAGLVGAVNPFNDDIQRIFGDQGGY